MAKAREIAKRRKAVANTKKITKTMEMIATSKFRKAMNRLSGSRAYGDALEDLAGLLFSETGHPLLEARDPVKHVTLWAFTGNRGLCGGFNSGVLRLMRQRRDELLASGVPVTLWMTGKKGMVFARYNKLEVARSIVSPEDRTDWEEVSRLAGELADDFLSLRTDRVELVYNRFTSTTSQKAVAQATLPVPLEQRLEEGGGYFWDPPADAMRGEILSRVWQYHLYRIFLESGAVEQVARRVAMKNATDSAEDMIKMLTRAYNRARQYQITQEISELVGGAEAQKA